jgi:putative ABC transport system permease protein
MSPMSTGGRFFKLPWRSRATIARDVDAELSFHLDMRIAELRARGLSEDAARQQTMTEFGDLDFTRAYCLRQDESSEREDQRADRLAEWRQDLIYAARTLRRSPAFATVSLLTLAISIGANTAVFTVSRAVLLQPLPFADAGRVYRITSSWPGHPTDEVPLSPADFADFQKRQTSFTDLGAIVPSGPVIWRPKSGDPTSLDALVVGSNLFTILGTPALHGRPFVPSDEVPGNDHKVVLSFDCWQRDFGGDASVVGRSIELSGASYQVIGVMPRGFLIGQHEEVWLPYDQSGTIKDVVRARKQHYVHAIGRLKAGITPAHALADLRTIAGRLAREYPEADSARSAIMRPVRNVITGDLRPALLLLQGAVALVLLIACANLANLALSRAMGRRRELATRAALGAGRARLVRQLVTESVLLSILGGALGVGLAMAATRVLLSLNPTTLPPMFDARVDRSVLAFSFVISVVTGVLFGLLPALDASSGNLHEALKDGGRGSSGGRASARVRRTLVVAQVALAIMLLTGAGLLIRSFGELTRVTLGYDPNGVVTAGLRAAGDRYDDPVRINTFYDRVIDELSRASGVTAVGAVSDLPTRGGSGTSLRIEGEPNDEARLPDLTYLSVRGDFFEALHIPIVAGRAYDARDRPDVSETAIINETAARRFFPKGDAVGRRIRIGPDPRGAWMTIIGVAGDIRSDGLDTPVKPTLYANHRHEAWMRSMSLVMRTSRTATDAGALIRRAVRAQDPSLAIRDMQTLNDVVGGSLASRRFALGLATSFAFIALTLAAIGIYGVLAYNVGNRTREFGVRIALGASWFRVVSLVVRHGVVASLAGIIAGLIGAMLGARLLSGMLFGVTPLDAGTYASVVLLVLIVAMIACIVPALRATRVDPLTSMRAD